MPLPKPNNGETCDKLFQTDLEAEPGGRAVVAMISTTSVDRDGDVVMPSGVELRNFAKNPVVLLMHRADRLPIAKVPMPGGIRQFPHGIQAKAIMERRPPSLPKNIEWEPDTILDLFRQKAPLGFSIGFKIKNARVPTKQDKGRFGTEVERVITHSELLEFSVVPVPCNQDALAVAVSKCHGPVGPYVRSALGLSQMRNIKYRAAAPRILSLDFTDPPVRLKI